MAWAFHWVHPAVGLVLSQQANSPALTEGAVCGPLLIIPKGSTLNSEEKQKRRLSNFFRVVLIRFGSAGSPYGSDPDRSGYTAEALPLKILKRGLHTSALVAQCVNNP
jgi:hypothetical protein